MQGKSKETEEGQAAERYASLVALSSDIYWEQDAQYRFTHFSGSRTQMVAALKRTTVGKRRWEQQYFNMTDAAWAAHQALLEAREPFQDLELGRLDESGNDVWISVTGEPVFDRGGRFTGYRGFGKDITPRKRAEALAQLEHSIARALATAETSAAGVHAVMRTIGELERWTVGRYFAADDSAGMLRFADGWCTDGDELARQYLGKSQGMAYRMGQGLSGQAWQSRDAIWVRDVSKDGRSSGSARIAGQEESALRRAALVIPVAVQNRTLGVLSFANRVVREPDERLLGSLRAIGNQLGQFLQRKHAEADLAESEVRFRQTFELAASGVAHVSLDGRFMRVNRHLCEILGYPEQELIGRSVKEISRPEDRDVTDAQRARMRRGELRTTSFEKRYLRKDGSTVWVNLTVGLARNAAGEPQYEISIIEDITERKEAEAQLRRFRAGLDGAADMVFLVDPATARMLDFNDAVCRTLGYARDELLGEPATLVRADRAVRDLISDYQRFSDLPDKGETVQVQYRHRSGELIPVESMRRLIDTPEGSIVVINSRDLRERRAAERALRESEERFRNLTKLSSDWYWEHDAQFRFTKFEGGGAGGYSPGPAVLGKRVWELGGIDASSADWDAHRAVLERRAPFRDFEYSYKDREGHRYYISASGEPMFDEDGRFRGYRGTARDISRRRRDEEELRRFRAAMDMSVDAIFLTDRRTMRFIDVNKAACNAVGIKRAQLLELGPDKVFRLPKTEIEREFDEVIAKGHIGIRTERSYFAGDGSERWTELHRRALRADDSWIILTIARDTTERKLAEQRRARHLRRQERVARFGQNALAKRDAGELTLNAVQTVLEALGAEAVGYLEPGPQSGDFVLRALVGVVSEGSHSGVLHFAQSHPARQVCDAGKAAFVSGAEADIPWTRSFGSVALVPVRAEQAVRGVLCVAQRADDGFGAEALNFIDAISTILSTALQRIDSEARLTYLAQFDALTGLPNRALLTDRFTQVIVQAQRRGTTLGVLFVDLDEFKIVNDTLGHAAGDELLKQAAVRLQSTVRTGDTVARIAGDEFALVLADLAKADDAALVAQKIIRALAEAFEVRGREILVTASIGIATYPVDGSDAEGLLACADAAMYRAKQAGRNAYQFFTPDLNARMRARAQTNADLRRALERREFDLYYQPKFDLQERVVSGIEALLRWRHPERGLVAPGEFIPLLEESGLIIGVGEWALQHACESLAARLAQGIAPHSVAVNLSARQFRQHDLAARLTNIIAASGVDAGLIEFEITESQLMHDPEHAVRTLQKLREAGMGIAIDDFGTGYSSLSYLTRFPLSALKIDRSFVASALEDKAAAAIVRAIIELAHTLGFTVIAEGVETEAQAAFLHGLRCDEAQGYLFARPMTAEQLSAMLTPPVAQAGIRQRSQPGRARQRRH
jgi:diguanylate cyclase (GGDEF)-like protein/PAS domain S-box-containing protein